MAPLVPLPYSPWPVQDGWEGTHTLDPRGGPGKSSCRAALLVPTSAQLGAERQGAVGPQGPWEAGGPWGHRGHGRQRGRGALGASSCCFGRLLRSPSSQQTEEASNTTERNRQIAREHAPEQARVSTGTCEGYAGPLESETAKNKRFT